MIILLLLKFFEGLLVLVFSWLPTVTELPLGLDSILTSGMGYFWFLKEAIPPFDTMFIGFLVILTFKVSLMILRAIPIIGKIFSAHSSGFH